MYYIYTFGCSRSLLLIVLPDQNRRALTEIVIFDAGVDGYY